MALSYIENTLLPRATSLRQDGSRRDVPLWIFRPVDKIAWKCGWVQVRCGERVILSYGILY